MHLPFTSAQFFEIFRAYNTALWPAPVLLTALALGMVAAAVRPREWTHVFISAALAGLWLWTAVAYHLAFFARINPAAYVFVAVCLLGTAAFVRQGIVARALRFRVTRGWRAAVGAALVLYALVVYPLWTWLSGHPYPAMPTFGLPCPTTLFTVGMLCFLERPHPPCPVFAPLIWSVIGASAAFLLGVQADMALIASALVSVEILRRGRQGDARTA